MVKCMSPMSSQRAKLVEAIEIASRIARCDPDEQTLRATVQYCLSRNIDGFPANMFSNNRDYIDSIDVEESMGDLYGSRSRHGHTHGSSVSSMGSLASPVKESSSGGPPPLYCTLFLFDDKLLIAKRQSTSVNGRKVTGLDDVSKLVRSGGGVAVKEKDGAKNWKLSYRGTVNILDVIAVDLGDGDFQLFLEKPPMDQSDRWSGRPLRTYTAVNPPTPLGLDPATARSEKLRFVQNLWALQAVARTKVLPSQLKEVPRVLTSHNDVSVDSEHMRVKLYWNLWTRKGWESEHTKAKVAMQVSAEHEEKSQSDLTCLEPPNLVFRLVAIEGDLVRIAYSGPNTMLQTTVCHLEDVNPRLVSIISDQGCLKFDTSNIVQPHLLSTPGKRASRLNFLTGTASSRSNFGGSSYGSSINSHISTNEAKSISSSGRSPLSPRSPRSPTTPQRKTSGAIDIVPPPVKEEDETSAAALGSAFQPQPPQPHYSSFAPGRVPSPASRMSRVQLMREQIELRQQNNLESPSTPPKDLHIRNGRSPVQSGIATFAQSIAGNESKVLSPSPSKPKRSDDPLVFHRAASNLKRSDPVLSRTNTMSPRGPRRNPSVRKKGDQRPPSRGAPSRSASPTKIPSPSRVLSPGPTTQIPSPSRGLSPGPRDNSNASPNRRPSPSPIATNASPSRALSPPTDRPPSRTMSAGLMNAACMSPQRARSPGLVSPARSPIRAPTPSDGLCTPTKTGYIPPLPPPTPTAEDEVLLDEEPMVTSPYMSPRPARTSVPPSPSLPPSRPMSPPGRALPQPPGPAGNAMSFNLNSIPLGTSPMRLPILGADGVLVPPPAPSSAVMRSPVPSAVCTTGHSLNVPSPQPSRQPSPQPGASPRQPTRQVTDENSPTGYAGDSPVLSTKRQHTADYRSPRKRVPSDTTRVVSNGSTGADKYGGLGLGAVSRKRNITPKGRQTSGALTPTRRVSAMSNGRSASAKSDATMQTTDLDDVVMSDHADLPSAADSARQRIADARKLARRLRQDTGAVRKHAARRASGAGVGVLRSPRVRGLSEAGDEFDDVTRALALSSDKLEATLVSALADAERVRMLVRSYDAQASRVASLEAALDEARERAAALEVRLQQGRQSHDLLRAQLAAKELEVEEMYNAFNAELDGMYNDATLALEPQTEAMRADLQRTKTRRNALEVENAKLRLEREEMELRLRQLAEVVRSNGLVVGYD